MLNIFKSKAKEKNEAKALLAALYSVLGADNEGSEQEYEFFKKVCKEKGFDKQEISEVISNNSRLSMDVPAKREKQEEFFSELVSMVIIDGTASPNEILLLEKFAKMMKLADTDEGINTYIDNIIKQKKGQ
jgi:uncharacterized tellurite resistance protein B-like protein